MNAQKTGLFISDLRKEKGMTQKQLAEALFVSDKAVSRWETGRGFPEISILERIGEVLNVSTAELIKGERIEGSVSVSEIKNVVDESADLAKRYIDRNRLRYTLSGLLSGMIILLMLVVHLNSPVYFDDPDAVVKIETLADDRIIALIDEKVSGFEVDECRSPEGLHYYTLMCYSTKWDKWFGNRKEKIAVFADKEDIDFISYAPGKQGDVILYKAHELDFAGMETLPRLIYNGWIVLGIIATAVTGILYLLNRKKYSGEIIFKIMLLPLSFTLSMIMVLWGRFDEVYNAAYYFSFIILLTILIYALMRLIYRILREQHHKRNNDNKI